MFKLKSSACIDASVSEVWKVLSDIKNVSMWIDPIRKSFCSGDINRGVGAKRTCVLKGNITIYEKWIDWQEGQSFTYEGFDIPLTKYAKNTWSVKREGDKTLLTSQAEIELKGGIFGKLLEPVMIYFSKKMAADSLASFKYLVEKGCPFEGKLSSLARVPVSC